MKTNSIPIRIKRPQQQQQQQQHHELRSPSSRNPQHYNNYCNGGVRSQSLGTSYPGKGLMHRQLSDISAISYAGYLQKRSNRPHNHHSSDRYMSCYAPFPPSGCDNNNERGHSPSSFTKSQLNKLNPPPLVDMEEYSSAAALEEESQSHLPQHHQVEVAVVLGNSSHSSNNSTNNNIHSKNLQDQNNDGDEQSMAFAASFFGVDLRLLHPNNEFNNELKFTLEAEEEKGDGRVSATTTRTAPTISRRMEQQTPTQQSPASAHLEDKNDERGEFQQQTRRTSLPISIRSSSSLINDDSARSCPCGSNSNNKSDGAFGGHPSDMMDEDGHIWRSKYCVLEGGILYWYRHQSDAEAPEAHWERQQHALRRSNEHAEVASPKNNGGGCGGGMHISDFAQSPMPRKYVRDGVPRSWEKFVALGSVGSVRSAEVEFGPNSFELTSSALADADDGGGGGDSLLSSFSSFGGQEKLILRARNSEEMNEWLWQFHRSIDSYVLDIMECAASSSNHSAVAAANSAAMASTSPSTSSTEVQRSMDIHHPAYSHQRPPRISVDTSSSVATSLPYSPRFLYQPTTNTITATTPLSHGHGRNSLHRRRFHQHPSPLGQSQPKQYHQQQRNERRAFSYQEASPHLLTAMNSRSQMPLIPQHSGGGGISSRDHPASFASPLQLAHRFVTPTPPPRGGGDGELQQQQQLVVLPQQREQLVEEASSSVTPELSSLQQSDDPETERPPPSAAKGGGKKYVPPHLRNKNRAALIGTSMPPSPKTESNSSSAVTSSSVTSLAAAVGGRGGGPSNGGGTDAYGHQQHQPPPPLLRPRPSKPLQNDPDAYDNHGSASLDESDLMLMNEMDDVFQPYIMMEEQILNVKMGGCADPDLVGGSILDDMYIPRKASRLSKGASDPFGSTFTSGRRRSSDGNDSGVLRWEIGATSVIGIRESNEDAYLIVGDLLEAFKSHHGDSSSSPQTFWDHHGSSSHAPSLFAVFDGHCGDHAARFAAERLLPFLHEQSLIQQDMEVETELSSEDRLDQLREIMRQTVSNLDNTFCNLCVEQGREWESGTTALIATLVNEHLVIANLGDARGVLCRSVEDEGAVEAFERDGWTAVPWTDCTGSSRCLWKEVTDIHSPSRGDERVRIEKANGWVTTEKEIPVGQLKRMVLFDQDVVDILMRCFSDRYQPQSSPRASAPQRILQISRVCGELAVSRAIGDRDFKTEFNVRKNNHHDSNNDGNDESKQSSETPEQSEWDSPLCLPYPDDHSRTFFGDLISNQPEFRSIPIGQDGVSDEFLLLACDGLWDVMDADDAVRLTRDLLFVKGWSAKRAASRLAELAVHLGSSDNITVIVLRLYTS